MPVVVEEVSVETVASAAADSGSSAPPESGTQASRPPQRELHAELRRLRERAERVRAH
jgi:hypothetical protein